MIRITYSHEQQPLAERIRDDLGAAQMPAQPTLIVLVSARSNGDRYVQAEIERALREGEQIVPILAEAAAPPPPLAGMRALDFRAGYDRERLLQTIGAGDGGA